MRFISSALKSCLLLAIPVITCAQVAPGEDPVFLKEKVVVNMLPLNNTMRSTPLPTSPGIPAWMDARMARYQAKAYSIDTSGIFTDKDVKTTMIYTHVLNRGGKSVRSPADGLAKAFQGD